MLRCDGESDRRGDSSGTSKSHGSGFPKLRYLKGIFPTLEGEEQTCFSFHFWFIDDVSALRRKKACIVAKKYFHVKSPRSCYAAMLVLWACK